MLHHRIQVQAPGQGLVEISAQLKALLAEHPVGDGLMNLFIRHTSASLIVQENADPAVCADLEHYLNRLVPEGDAAYTHTQEGPDDMPAHIKGALTATQLLLPIVDGELALGTWQGVFVWEHRRQARQREVLVTITTG